MANLAQIYDWFMTGKKPTQPQFWASWGSFWNKEESIPQSAISNLTAVLNAKAEKAQFDAHKTDENAHADLFDAKEDKTKKGVAGGYVPLDEFVKIANEYLTIVNDLVTGGATSLASAETVKTLKTQIDGINILLSSDNVNLDNVQELVDAIETIQMSLSSILVNDLTTGGTTKALTAEMGKLLELTKENVSNKATIILEGTNESSNTLYPTIKAVYDWCVARFQKLLLNIETTASINYTLDYTNSAKRTVFTSANPVSVTVPTNSVSPIPVGARRQLTAQGDGIVTIGGAGITFTTNLSLSMVKGETRTLTKIATDTWTVEGNLPVAGALSYKTYFVNSATGNNATGVYQDSNHPYATIDYILNLPTLKEFDIISIQSTGTFYINSLIQVSNISIVSDYNVTLSFANNTLSTLSSLNSEGTWNFFIPKGTIDFRSGVTKTVNQNNTTIKIIANIIRTNSSFKFNQIKEALYKTNELIHEGGTHIGNVGSVCSSFEIKKITVSTSASVLVNTPTNVIFDFDLITGTHPYTLMEVSYGYCTVLHGDVNISFNSCVVLATFYGNGLLKFKGKASVTGMVSYMCNSTLMVQGYCEFNTANTCNSTLFGGNGALGGVGKFILDNCYLVVKNELLRVSGVWGSTSKLTIINSYIKTNSVLFQLYNPFADVALTLPLISFEGNNVVYLTGSTTDYINTSGASSAGYTNRFIDIIGTLKTNGVIQSGLPQNNLIP